MSATILNRTLEVSTEHSATGTLGLKTRLAERDASLEAPVCELQVAADLVVR